MASTHPSTSLAARAEAQPFTLGQFYEFYLAQRRQGSKATRRFRKSQQPASEATLLLHEMTLHYLVGWFGSDRPVSEIEPDDISDWIEALASGELNHLRRWKRNVGPPSDETLRKQVRLAKSIFNWATQHGCLPTNPMADFAAPCRPSRPNHHVTREELEALCHAAKARALGTLFCLCRLAGLRRSEALALPWEGEAIDRQGVPHPVGLDWDRRRILLVSPKTRAYREIPLEPTLHDRLREDWAERSGEPATPIAPVLDANIVRTARKTMLKAGLEPWAKPYQAMRSSWENDLKQAGVPEATFANWLGHSVAISRMHYTAPMDTEYARIAEQGATGSV